jgi:hypothetical protein
MVVFRPQAKTTIQKKKRTLLPQAKTPLTAICKRAEGARICNLQ